MKNRFQYAFPAFGFHGFLYETLNILHAVPVLGRIGYIISLNQNLIVYPVNIGERMVMADKVRNSANLFFCHSRR